MFSSRKWTISLERRSRNKLNPDITRRKIRKIAETVSPSFEAKPGKLRDPDVEFDPAAKADVYRYTVNIHVSRDKIEDMEKVELEWEHILGLLTKVAAGEDWTLSQPAGAKASEQGILSSSDSLKPASQRPCFVLPALSEETRDTYFGDIYERQDQLQELYGALRTHVETAGEVANHAILYGQPGACKTVLCERIRDWLNADGSRPTNEWVRFVDGTTTTKAGAEQYFRNLVDGDDVPAVLVLDEIEKNEKSWLLSLLSIMGSGIVTKLNFRTGNYRQRFAPFIIGICNDEQSLREFKNESLWSRFTHEIYCPRPTRELAYLIMLDIVEKIPGGNKEWAEAAMTFGWDELGQRDVRKIKGNLDGRETLLDGSWQRSRRKMLEIERREKEIIQTERSRQILKIAN